MDIGHVSERGRRAACAKSQASALARARTAPPADEGALPETGKLRDLASTLFEIENLDYLLESVRTRTDGLSIIEKKNFQPQKCQHTKHTQ